MAAHNELGKWGESLAADYLTAKGYTILARNWRVGHRDIDIVAFHNNTLVIIEVKTRTANTFVSPEEAVDYQKIRSLCIAANAYVKLKRINAPIRFDIIAITGNASNYDINHIEQAFLPPLSRRR